MGLVVIGAEVRTHEGVTGSFDVAAPCPRCARGWYAEFPRRGRSPWGRDGYWRGQDHTSVQITCRCDNERMTTRQAITAATRAREQAQRVMASTGIDPDGDSFRGTPEPPPEVDQVPGAAPEAGRGGEGETPPPSGPPEAVPHGHHFCPHYPDGDRIGRVVDWTVSECPLCSPVEPLTTEEITTL